MRIGTPRAVGDLLVEAVPRLGERLLEREVRRAWPALVGPDTARRTQPQTVTGGCLTVRVDNSPWLHELTLRADELTRRVGARFSEIRTLRFVLGSLEPAEDVPGPRRRAGAPGALDAAARAEIDQAAAAIHDEALAAAARRLMTKAWRFERERGVPR